MNVPPPVPASAATNPLLADALARAQALAVAKPATKRPSDDTFDDGPNHKRPFQQNNMMEGAPAGPGMSTEQVMLPDNMVGVIIGRGGEQITRLHAESGCKPRPASQAVHLNGQR